MHSYRITFYIPLTSVNCKVICLVHLNAAKIKIKKSTDQMKTGQLNRYILVLFQQMHTKVQHNKVQLCIYMSLIKH